MTLPYVAIQVALSCIECSSPLVSGGSLSSCISCRRRSVAASFRIVPRRVRCWPLRQHRLRPSLYLYEMGLVRLIVPILLLRLALPRQLQRQGIYVFYRYTVTDIHEQRWGENGLVLIP